MNLVWFRNDLRTRDNPALYHACQAGPTLAVFVVSPSQWLEHNESPRKISFLLNSLTSLSEDLASLNIPLKILWCDTFAQAPDALLQACENWGVDTLWFNRELLLNELSRDKSVAALLNSARIHVRPQAADLIHQPHVLKNKSGAYYKVFTPFYRAWIAKLPETAIEPLPKPQKQEALLINADQIPDRLPGWTLSHRQDLWPAGCAAAAKKLNAFIGEKHKTYTHSRDIPSISGTSELSPYLALGALSVRECIEAIRMRANDEHWETSKWLAELVWREFYRYLVAAHPNLCKGQDFRATQFPIPWHKDEQLWSAWCSGNTGFPLVDAAMRQLNQTGWMHNRLRMVTASFLTKLLLIDWRQGEAYFMRHLIDGDYASNNGGWQWAASTGADAAPYFRIFNPTAQSEKFDPDGKFIKRFIPQLAPLDGKSIHNPSEQQRQGLDYPMPIIDYKTARKNALASYEGAFKPIEKMVG